MFLHLFSLLLRPASVPSRRLRWPALCLAAALSAFAGPVALAQTGDEIVLQAREALRAKDRSRLAGAARR